MDDRRSGPGSEAPAAPVADLERVSGRVDRVAVDRWRTDDGAWARPGSPGVLDEVAASLGLDSTELVALVRRARPLLVVTAITVIGSSVAPAAPWLLLVPAMVALLGLSWDRRVPFSFSDGVIGYREPGWPRGVQEEYDVFPPTRVHPEVGSDLRP